MNPNGQGKDMNGMMQNNQQIPYGYNFQYQMYRQPQMGMNYQYFYQMNPQFQQQQYMQQQQQQKQQMQQQQKPISTPDQQMYQMQPQTPQQMPQMQQQQYMNQQTMMQRQFTQMQLQNQMQSQMQANQMQQNRQQMMSPNAMTMQQMAVYHQYQQRMAPMMHNQYNQQQKMPTPPQNTQPPIKPIMPTPQIQQNLLPTPVPAPPPAPKKQKQPKQKKERKKKKSKNMDSDDSDADFGNDVSSAFDKIPEEFIEKRTSSRKTNQVSYIDDEDLIEEEDVKDTNDDPHKLDHIYFQREGASGMELLVRFQDSPQALCEWIPENTVMNLPKAQTHYSKFKAAPVIMSVLSTRDDSQPPYPVAHRRENQTAPYQLLFRFTYEANVLFYWDYISQETLTKYFQGLVSISLISPQIPPNLPPPNTYVKTPENVLRPYQVEGIRWLIGCWAQKHGSILADEMGLGKTIQILAFLSYISSIGWYGPFLITVRTNCFKQWCDEIEKWTNLKYIAYNGGPASRKMIREFQMPSLDHAGNPIPGKINFSILLVSYDVLLKDADFLQYTWQVIVVDEGHRIKNSQGKKNNALASLPYKHRIILTGTPIQNSLGELWALLKFVSPQFFQKDPPFLETDIEQLSDDDIRQMQNAIKPHLMRRSLGEVENSIAPKEERVALVRLSETQEELMRLIKLHSLWRLKGIKVNEETVDTAHEANDMHKVCLHPFLIDGAEEFYTAKFRNMSRLELLLSVSTKFAWLDRILTTLKREGHRVLIFSQFIKLLRLLKEYCTIRGHSHELLTGQMGDVEKNAAVSRFADESTSSFVFLISTRAGSEGLNLTIADTAIIFDPDWNPQNDLQAQARVHRIGQTQKVDIIRLITYKTYEHEMFVRAQRKLELWRTMLGGTIVEDNSVNLPRLHKPPPVDFNVSSNLSFVEELEEVSTVVNDFSPSNLKQLQAPLEEKEEENYATSDADFLNTFPVEELDERRTKRSRSMSFALSASEASELFIRMRHSEYKQWLPINDKTPEQVVKFCLAAIIIAMRMMVPSSIAQFPLLLYYLEEDIFDFSMDLVACGSKHQVFNAFPPEHELSQECETCKYIKDELSDRGFETLMTIECRLVVSAWLRNHSKEDIMTSEPGNKKISPEIISKLFDCGDFDVYDPNIEAVMHRMRSDLIISGFNCCLQFSWWTGYEFAALCSALRNFCFSPEAAFEFHSHTGLLSKNTTSVACFAVQVKRLLSSRSGRSSVVIPPSICHYEDSPEAVSSTKAAWAWTTIAAQDANELLEKIELVSAIKDFVMRDAYEPIDENASMWTDAHTRSFLEHVMVVGLDRMDDILMEQRLPFYTMYLRNEQSIPEYIRSTIGLQHFMDVGARKFKNDDIFFNMPQITKLKFRIGKEVKKSDSSRPKKSRRKKISDDDESEPESGEDFI